MKLQFLPFVRRGFAGSLTAGADGIATVQLAVEVSDPGASKATAITQTIALRGPGHVTGVDATAFVRCHPPAGAEEVDPTTFPHVELSAVDLPWRFTPAAPDPKWGLRPWMALVVVQMQPDVTLDRDLKLGITRLTVGKNLVATELPNLEESWAWAHVELTGCIETDVKKFASWIASNPHACRARMLCPRRLDPRRRYIAAVVPTTEAGRRVGLDPKAAEIPSPAEFAWKQDATANVVLPVYHHWIFSTGDAGDFESLAAKLELLQGGAPLGVRDLDVTYVPLQPGAEAVTTATRFSGALRSAPSETSALPEVENHLRGLWARTNRKDEEGDPVVAPPVYGAAARGAVATRDLAEPPASDALPWSWGRDLNLHPAHRAVAGIGAALVREHQEELVAAAWDQLAAARDAMRAVRQAQLAAEVGRSAAIRMRRLPEDRLVLATSRVMRRLDDGQGSSLHRRLANDGVPDGVVSPNLRRVVRSGSAAGRRLRQKEPAQKNPAAKLVTALKPAAKDQPGALVASLAWPRLNGFVVKKSATTVTLKQTDLEAAIAAPGKAVKTAHDRLGQRLGRRDLHQTRLAARLNVRKGDADASASVLDNDRLRFTPRLDQALSTWLAQKSGDLFVPGLGAMPMERVALLEVNHSFVNALLIGANEAMATELVWREFPLNRRGTFLARFWEGRDAGEADITAIAEWKEASTLATSRAVGDTPAATLLLRSVLVRRCPGLAIYAVGPHPITGKLERKDPVIFGRIGADAIYAGFTMNTTTLQGGGWYLVLEEPPGETRFGLDAATNPPGVDPGTPASLDDIHWGHMPAGTHASAAALGELLPSSQNPKHAGGIAARTFQKPVQIFIPAAELLSRS